MLTIVFTVDDEFEPSSGSSDDEETIAKEEEQSVVTDVSENDLVHSV